MLNTLHKYIFGFDAQVTIITGWAWHYWSRIEGVSPEGEYYAITDGRFCFQRKYAV